MHRAIALLITLVVVSALTALASWAVLGRRLSGAELGIAALGAVLASIAWISVSERRRLNRLQLRDMRDSALW